jgi:hypothetical protein
MLGGYVSCFESFTCHDSFVGPVIYVICFGPITIMHEHIMIHRGSILMQLYQRCNKNFHLDISGINVEMVVLSSYHLCDLLWTCH